MGEVTTVNSGQGLIFPSPGWQVAEPEPATRIQASALHGSGEFALENWSLRIAEGRLTSLTISGEQPIHLGGHALRLIGESEITIEPDDVKRSFHCGGLSFTAAQLMMLSQSLKQAYSTHGLDQLQSRVKQPLSDRHTFCLVHAACSLPGGISDWIGSRSAEEATALMANISTVFENFQKLGLKGGQKIAGQCLEDCCLKLEEQKSPALIDQIPAILESVRQAKITISGKLQTRFAILYAGLQSDDRLRDIQIISQGPKRFARLEITDNSLSERDVWIRRAMEVAALCGANTLLIQRERSCDQKLSSELIEAIPEAFTGLEVRNFKLGSGLLAPMQRLSQFNHLLAEGPFADQLAQRIGSRWSTEMSLRSLELRVNNLFPVTFIKVPSLERLVMRLPVTSEFKLLPLQARSLPATLQILDVTCSRRDMDTLVRGRLSGLKALEVLRIDADKKIRAVPHMSQKARRGRPIEWDPLNLLQRASHTLKKLTLIGDIWPDDIFQGKPDAKYPIQFQIEPRYSRRRGKKPTNREIGAQLVQMLRALGAKGGHVQLTVNGKQKPPIEL